jgi:hypothetical protein
MDSGSIRQPRIHERHCIIKPPTDRSSEPLRQPSNLALTWKPQVGLLKTGTSIDKDLIGTIDQDISYPRLAQQRLQRTCTDAVPAQGLHRIEDGRVTHGKAFGSHGRGDIGGCVPPAKSDKPIAYEIQSHRVGSQITRQQGPHGEGHALT